MKKENLFNAENLEEDGGVYIGKELNKPIKIIFDSKLKRWINKK